MFLSPRTTLPHVAAAAHHHLTDQRHQLVGFFPPTFPQFWPMLTHFFSRQPHKQKKQTPP
jgi:hypothetical protein